MLEVEVKLQIANADVACYLEEKGFLRGEYVYEHDFYFNGALKDLRKEDKALRVREHRNLDTGEAVFSMNYKGPKLDQTTMTREEVEFVIPEPDQGKKMLEGLGFMVAGEVEKKRSHYHKGEVTCCVDQVTGLGEFLEIEILAPEEEYESALEQIQTLLRELGYTLGDTIRKSYLSMLM